MSNWISEQLKNKFSSNYSNLLNQASKIAVYTELGPIQSLYVFSDGSKLLCKHTN